MKIISYIPLGCLVVLMFFGYRYASHQTTTMRMLVDARSGFGSEPAGMVQTNKNLDSEAATVAKRRADALKMNQDALVMVNKASEDLAAVTAAMESHREARDAVQSKIEEGEATFDEVKAENEKVLAAMHNISVLSSADISEAAGILENTIKEFNAEYGQTASALEKKSAEREMLGKEISGLTMDLTDKRDTNRRFLDNYRRNGREFAVEAVDTRWHFVVFCAPEDYGFYAGDPERLLLKRGGQLITSLRVVNVSGGKVVAEYDEKTLPAGVQIEVGDQIIRQKPFGS